MTPQVGEWWLYEGQLGRGQKPNCIAQTNYLDNPERYTAYRLPLSRETKIINYQIQVNLLASRFTTKLSPKELGVWE